jgi:hypothetical protein
MKNKIIITTCLSLFLLTVVYTSKNNMSDSKGVTYSLLNIEALAADVELPEAVIECGQDEGRCWMQGFAPIYCPGIEEDEAFGCFFDGHQMFSCTPDC